jgi:hypothetical protein
LTHVDESIDYAFSCNSLENEDRDVLVSSLILCLSDSGKQEEAEKLSTRVLTIANDSGSLSKSMAYSCLLKGSIQNKEVA